MVVLYGTALDLQREAIAVNISNLQVMNIVTYSTARPVGMPVVGAFVRDKLCIDFFLSNTTLAIQYRVWRRELLSACNDRLILV